MGRMIVTVDTDGDEEHEGTLENHLLEHVAQMDGVEDLSVDYPLLDEEEEDAR